jgi:5'-nucleotidase (lipoprotein e(P4) family)
LKESVLNRSIAGVCIFSIFICALALPTAAQVNADDTGSDYLLATLWYQRSQESRANISSQFELAKLRLDQAIKDRHWTAAPEEQKTNFKRKPPAVILDIDETVLDNTPFVGWLIEQDAYYNKDVWPDWERWIMAAKAKALAGALDFVNYARSKKVKLFYISNRVNSQEAATRKNLKAEGFIIDEQEDTILLKHERQEWSSKKGVRRQVVAEKYRILLLLGNDLEDFVDSARSDLQERDRLFEKYRSFWGRQWIVLPCPVYGSWDEAAYDFDYSLSRSQIQNRMKEKLLKWDGK